MTGAMMVVLTALLIFLRTEGLASGLTLGPACGARGLGVTALGGLADVVGLPAVMAGIALLPALVFVMSLFVPERTTRGFAMTKEGKRRSIRPGASA